MAISFTFCKSVDKVRIYSQMITMIIGKGTEEQQQQANIITKQKKHNKKYIPATTYTDRVCVRVQKVRSTYSIST